MDFKRIISASIIPIIIFIVLGIVGVILGFLLSIFLATLGSLIGGLLGLGVFVVQCLILLWAGYQAAKKYQLDIVGSSATGALTAFVGAIINSIVSIIANFIAASMKLVPAVAAAGQNTGGTAALAGTAIGAGAAALICGPFLVLVSAVIAAVIGAILGAIGGFLGQSKKK